MAKKFLTKRYLHCLRLATKLDREATGQTCLKFFKTEFLNNTNMKKIHNSQQLPQLKKPLKQYSLDDDQDASLKKENEVKKDNQRSHDIGKTKDKKYEGGTDLNNESVMTKQEIRKTHPSQIMEKDKVQSSSDNFPDVSKPPSVTPPGLHKLKFAQTHEEKTRLSVSQFFRIAEEAGGTSEEIFQRGIALYKKNAGPYLRGHIEFAELTLQKVDEYELEHDLETYKKIMKLFPIGKYVPSSQFQVIFLFSPKQQYLALDILRKMDENGIIPDDEMGFLIIERFSMSSLVFTKFLRSQYWLSKLKHINPWPIQSPVPNDPVELAILALKRMSHDLETKICVWRTGEEMELEVGEEDTFIASAQSPKQKQLLAKHPQHQPLFIEGQHYVYYGRARQVYFVLKSDPDKEPPKMESDYYDSSEESDEKTGRFDFKLYFIEEEDEDEETAVSAEKSVHEQEDGNVFSLCITGDSSQQSLIRWLQFLQNENPSLRNIPVLFRLQEPDCLLKEAIENSEKDR